MIRLPNDFSPKKILVCQLRQLGDVLLATPALQLLHERFPQAALHLLTEKKCVPLVEGNPHLTHVWGLDKAALKPLWREVAWYWHVARQGFDLVVDFQQLPRCRWVVAFSGAQVRLSYTPPWYTQLLYNLTVTPDDGYAAMAKASVLKPLGIHWKGEKPRMYLSDQERSTARALLNDLGVGTDQPFITLDPTHRQATRRWPIQHYAELVHLLTQAHPLLRVLPLWGPGEEQDIQQLQEHFLALGGNAHTFVMPKAMLSLREMAACISFARLHVGNCSAPRHMAVALDTPSCTLLGSTSPSWTFPAAEHRDISAALPCQPCNKNTCPHSQCLTALKPVAVAAYIEQHFVAGLHSCINRF